LVRSTLEASGRARQEDVERNTRPVLSVVVPVYDGAPTIVENLRVIREAVTRGVERECELIVVSDGSLDATEELLLQVRTREPVRVIHYDRNLGKGYAVKAGVLASSGRFVAFIDADLDLDPASLPVFLETAIHDSLDIVIGSKRHPDSVVHYPRSRRIASWCYQQLNRVLFRLDVRDTQVGIKLFRSDVADQVFPLLLVKQFAIDLELLAVARALGFGRVREMPIRLAYRFSGSGVRSAAVLRALVDTAAIFYRLRILKTYQRKQRFLRAGDRRLDTQATPLVSVIGSDRETLERLDYPHLELVEDKNRLSALRAARGDIVAVMSEGSRPAGNWIGSSVPFFNRPTVSAVVAPVMPYRNGSLGGKLAAAISESRLGGGLRRWRFSPGNLRTVTDYPAGSVVVRRADYLDALESSVPGEQLVAWLTERGRQVVYTPETVVVAPPVPLVVPYLRRIARHARSRGLVARRTRGRSVGLGSILSFAPVVAVGAGIPLAMLGDGWLGWAGTAAALAYGGSIMGSSALAALRYRSPAVGAFAVPGFVATHVVYVASFLIGATRRT
jgi:glycosyltransferase involved in cell wall biosynthesis